MQVVMDCIIYIIYIYIYILLLLYALISLDTRHRLFRSNTHTHTHTHRSTEPDNCAVCSVCVCVLCACVLCVCLALKSKNTVAPRRMNSALLSAHFIDRLQIAPAQKAHKNQHTYVCVRTQMYRVSPMTSAQF